MMTYVEQGLEPYETVRTRGRFRISPSAPQKILSMNPLLERIHRQYLHLDFGLTTIVILSWEASVSLEHTSPTFCLHIISTDHQVTLLIV
jgi:hypothetical protein